MLSRPKTAAEFKTLIRVFAVIPAANDAINDRPPEHASDRAQFILAVQKASNQAFRKGMWFGMVMALVIYWGVPKLLDLAFR